ncbi:MAG: ATP-binding protein [Parabacteroides sp.]
MASNLIGRIKEQAILNQCYASDKAELVAVYGRRRVGKTFLVKTFFKDQITFYTTGIYEGTKKEQLAFFHKQLVECTQIAYPLVDNWFDAFDQLKHFIMHTDKERVLLFFDELPWMDTPRSRFLKAFELFWNSWAADQPKVKLIVCGSATTWMMSHLLGDKGGLHNRVTRRIKLSPFNLAEVKAFITNKGIEWNDHQIAELYMIMGGTPYYLQMLQKGLSLSQNIDELFFSENAELREEYSFLFRSLFKNASLYRNVIELLSKKAQGMTRMEIIQATKTPEGGMLSNVLEDLCHCDFIRKYAAFGKKERDALYQLTDLFSLFYLRFVKNSQGRDEHLWTNMIDSPARRAWSGYAFEQLCLHHIPQIKHKLGIAGVQSDVCSWNVIANEEHKGAQIDLLIDRRDQVINLCEMKFSTGPYLLTKAYSEQMMARKELFRAISKTRKALHLTLITTYGLQPNLYAGEIQSEVTLTDLFQSV